MPYWAVEVSKLYLSAQLRFSWCVSDHFFFFFDDLIFRSLLRKARGLDDPHDPI